MRRLELFFLFVRLPADYLALIGAATTAYFLRFTTFADFRPATQIISFDEYITLALALGIVWIAIFAFSGLYLPRLRIVDELAKTVAACSTGTMAVIAVLFFSREFFASRFIVLAVWALSVLLVGAARLTIRLIQRDLFWRGVGSRGVVLVGSGRAAEAVGGEISQHPEAGYRLVKRHDSLTSEAAADLRKLAAETQLDEIILVNPRPSDDELRRILEISDELHLTVRYSADLYAARRAALDVTAIAGVPLVEIKKTPLEGWGRVYKRIFDLVFGTILLALSLPVMLVVALAIVFDSPGPFFFVHRRIGQYGLPFTFFKFRSMKRGAHEEWEEVKKFSERPGPVPKIKEDPRVTRVGRFIRRWSLDELPQFINVIIGNMSLVGPRPHLPEEVEKYEPHQRRVLIVKPGVTGLAQISGRADLSFDEEVALDVSYIERWSSKLDLSILMRTPAAVFRKKGAY